MSLPPLVPPGADLTGPQRRRYARHLLLPELGGVGQRRLRAASVLVVGAGGLGAPVLQYLAAAGVGRIAVIDDDAVDETNLQRQVVHGVADIGRAKVDSAASAVRAIAPETEVVALRERLTADTSLARLAEHDLVVDGADNFPTRYLVGDAAARLAMPHVWGSVYRFDGQASVWLAGEGPCYACVFPTPPPAGAVPSCATGGVLGATCGVIGSVLAGEAVKLVTGVGEPLVGRLLVHDALRQETSTLPVGARPTCPVCGPDADPARAVGWLAQADVCRVPGSEPDAPDGVLPAVSVRELAALLGGDEPVVLLDVREPGEREIAVISGATSLPLGALRAGEAVPTAPGARVYVHCKSGARSAEAVALLRERGVDAVDVTGGITAWSREVDSTVPEY